MTLATMTIDYWVYTPPATQEYTFVSLLRSISKVVFMVCKQQFNIDIITIMIKHYSRLIVYIYFWGTFKLSNFPFLYLIEIKIVEKYSETKKCRIYFWVKKHIVELKGKNVIRMKIGGIFFQLVLDTQPHLIFQLKVILSKIHTMEWTAVNQ